MSSLQLVAVFFILIPIVQASELFQYLDLVYESMQDGAVLFFGEPNPENEAIIQILASNNSNLVTWTHGKQQESESTLLRPIIITNEIGLNFVNCLFFAPNNASLITDFYTEKMLSSLKFAKLVLLTHLGSLDSQNDGFFHILEWFVGIVPNAANFMDSIMLIVTGTGVNRTAPGKIFELLFNYTQQSIDNCSLPDAAKKMKIIATLLQSPTKIGVSWQILNAIGTLNLIPSNRILPSDVNLFSERNTTVIDALISSITEDIVQTFNIAVAYLDDIFPNISEESFADRLNTLKRTTNVLKQTLKEVKSSRDFSDAAQRIDFNMRAMGFFLDPFFRRNVSIGQELLHHIQKETGRTGSNIHQSVAQITIDRLINATAHHTMRYTRFSELFEELDNNEGHNRIRRSDNLENLVDMLATTNMTMNPELRARASSSSQDSNEDPIFTQEKFPDSDSELFSNTPYKVHLAKNTDCFLTTIPYKFDNPYCEKDFPKGDKLLVPTIACSKKDKKDLYDNTESTWFLRWKNGILLMNLKTGGQDFLRIKSTYCTLINSSISYYTYMLDGEIELQEPYLRLQGDRNAIFINFNDGPTLTQKRYDGIARAGFKYGPGSSPVLRFTSAIILEAKLSGFQFIVPEQIRASKKDFAESFEIANNGTTTVKRTIELSETVTDTFSFGFTQDLSICNKVSAEAKVDFLGLAEAKTSVEVSTDLHVGSHKDWSKSTSKTFQMTYEVTVPEYTTAHISAWYEKIEDIKMAFTSTMKISGKVSKISKYNDVLEGEAASGGDIRKYLASAGGWKESSAKFVKIEDYYVEYELTGEMTASMGLLGQIGVQSSPLKH